MSKRSLKNKISKKLDQLSGLLDNIDEARIINTDDLDTWDPDVLYNLAENLKETLKLLEDQKIKGKYDEFGQPLTEDGLCSLVDIYQEEQEDDDYGK